MTERSEEELLQRVTAEALTGATVDLELALTLHSAMSIVGALQLALRHPGLAGSSPTSLPPRNLIDAIIATTEAQGYVATAELMRMGGNQEHDMAISIRCPRCGLVSHNLNDVTNRYCGNCHKFLDDPQ